MTRILPSDTSPTSWMLDKVQKMQKPDQGCLKKHFGSRLTLLFGSTVCGVASSAYNAVALIKIVGLPFRYTICFIPCIKKCLGEKALEDLSLPKLIKHAYRVVGFILSAVLSPFIGLASPSLVIILHKKLNLIDSEKDAKDKGNPEAKNKSDDLGPPPEQAPPPPPESGPAKYQVLSSEERAETDKVAFRPSDVKEEDAQDAKALELIKKRKEMAAKAQARRAAEAANPKAKPAAAKQSEPKAADATEAKPEDASKPEKKVAPKGMLPTAELKNVLKKRAEAKADQPGVPAEAVSGSPKAAPKAAAKPAEPKTVSAKASPKGRTLPPTPGTPKSSPAISGSSKK